MIDWTQIKQLKEDVGLEDLAEVIEVFIEEVDEAVDVLRDVTQLDAATMETSLHFLKGSALNLGFADFATLCAQGEAKAKENAPNAFDLTKVAPAYDASKKQFLAELSAEVGITM